MAKPVTHEAKVSIGLEQAEALANKQEAIARSDEQKSREDKREAILRGREAHRLIFGQVFSLDRGARAKNAENPSVIFYARFHHYDRYGTISEEKLKPFEANIAVVGATIAIPRDPRLHMGPDIRQDDLEHRLIVAAAIKDLRSPARDIESEEQHTLDGLYVPADPTQTMDEFHNSFYETISHNSGEVMAASLDISEGDVSSELTSNNSGVLEALKVIDALSAATLSRTA